MSKKRNDFFDRLVYFTLRLVAGVLHCFPVNVDLRTARFLGDCLYTCDRKHRMRAMANLARCFPHMTEPELKIMTRRSVQHLVMLGCEVLFTTRLIRIDTFSRYFELTQFQPALRLMLQRNQGLIMLTGHYGNWEVLGYLLAALGFETTSVARPLDNAYVNKWLLGVRQKQGQRIIDKKGASSEVTDILANGGVVAFIADQNAGTKGIFVDFFGRMASTYKSIGLLAMEYRVPVVIGFASRINNNFHFQVGVQDIIWPEQWDQEEDSLRYITQRYTKAIEDIIRADPGQYLWVHRRWKTRPRGEVAQQYD